MISPHAAVVFMSLFGIVQGTLRQQCWDTVPSYHLERCDKFLMYYSCQSQEWTWIDENWGPATEMCCACGGGTPCTDTDYGATDMLGKGCSGIVSALIDCPRLYDDWDFSAYDMCCDCGGGWRSTPAPTPPLPPTPAPTPPPPPTPAPTPPPTPAPTPPATTTSTQTATTATQTATKTTETGTSSASPSSSTTKTTTTTITRTATGTSSSTSSTTATTNTVQTATTVLGGNYSINAPWAEEQRDSEGLLAVFAGAVIFLLACVALGVGCLMRHGCPGRGRGPAHDRGMRDAQIEISVSELDAEIDEHQPDQKDELPETMDFWFLPVTALMSMPRNKPVFRHQVLRDLGLLVKRTMTLEDVFGGRFVADTAAVSHRWPEPEHFDPNGSKLCELQDILAKSPSIKFVWIDWVCAPQWHGGGRTDEEEEEFRMILENILPFIFLGCTVIVLYERIYNQRFWPNVECWIATKMVTEDGLVPATEDRLRLKVHGIESAKELNCTVIVLDSWHHADAQTAIHILSQKDILVTNAKDKEINLRVVGSLDRLIRSRDRMPI
ncbi:unnamed protein product [Prorocentrum cordatum]|uniref:Heterokaryon incompatibility domain-containing protein n=1 Tax=Prorocentrum cordatum TaxID=2364126 RepID=A0ABN9SE98_9DINO|nr:unnamed protein product [Polarella glacialis]